MRKELANPDSEVLNSPFFPRVIRTLLYFDIFSYPLKLEEIHRFIDISASQETLVSSLDKMLRAGYIFKTDCFYSLHHEPAKVERRRKGNNKAAELMPVARQRAELISRFPFVRCVMASGSLSKGYMDEHSDLDFFIVTASGRLWVARMLLVIYKRLFLGNSSREFCVNYFVSEDDLTIEEQNRFTATELATVIPLTSPAHYTRLMSCNAWIYDFFPNFVPRPVIQKNEKRYPLKSVGEWIINCCGGRFLDLFFMRLTKQRWHRLYGKQFNADEFNIAFKSGRNVSKGHPKHYQKKVTESLEAKWETYSRNFR